MANLKKWTALAAGGAAISLAGVMCMGAGLAGAQSSDAVRHSAPTVSPSVKFKPGTYEWYNDGNPYGTITVAKHSVFSSTIASDTGTWVQSGKTFGLYITGGGDASGDCVFAGKVKASGTGVSSASKPGNWACPGLSGGTFYIGPVPPEASATRANGNSFTSSSARPTTAGPLVPGTYLWTLDGYYTGNITFATGNTYTSTLTGDDSGGWVQGGSSIAITIAGGADGGGGCLQVGKVNAAGTAVGTSGSPGNWVCPGYATKGTFVIN